MWSFNNDKNLPEKPGETEVPDDVSGFTQLHTEDGEIAIDLVDICQNAIENQGVVVTRLDGEQANILHLPVYNIYLQTMGLEINPNENGVHVATRTDARAQSFEEGLVEYQHGMGETIDEAIEAGYRQWAQLDLPVICDVASSNQPENSRLIQKELEEQPGVLKEAYLGQTLQVVGQSQSQKADLQDKSACLASNCMEALQPLFESEALLSVILFAARTETGELRADVRVNGHELPGGVAALKKYAESWAGTGFETRKQYVVFRSVKKPVLDS